MSIGSRHFKGLGHVPQQQFVHCEIGQRMPHNFAAESFRAKELCRRFSFMVLHFCVKNGHFSFLNPRLGA